MHDDRTLIPATELAAKSTIDFPGESPEYRAARTALLAEEIELRRHIEHVARQRRALPPGPVVQKDYSFVGEEGPVPFAGLFGQHDTLVAYKFMYGPERKRPCPMCTAAMSAWDGEANDIGQRVSFVMIARSPIERLVAFKRERGWRNLRLYSDMSGEYTRNWVHPEDADVPGLNVFIRSGDTIRHFWGDEMGQTADPGEDPRGAPDLMPLWNFLDLTPAGRGADWYPKLSYPGQDN
jgi:predicted dithiol-disulfide oxidoreductase (DUF899 family)